MAAKMLRRKNFTLELYVSVLYSRLWIFSSHCSTFECATIHVRFLTPSVSLFLHCHAHHKIHFVHFCSIDLTSLMKQCTDLFTTTSSSFAHRVTCAIGGTTVLKSNYSTHVGAIVVAAAIVDNDMLLLFLLFDPNLICYISSYLTFVSLLNAIFLRPNDYCVCVCQNKHGKIGINQINFRFILPISIALSLLLNRSQTVSKISMNTDLFSFVYFFLKNICLLLFCFNYIVARCIEMDEHG